MKQITTCQKSLKILKNHYITIQIGLLCNKQSRECLHVNTSKSLHIHGTAIHSAGPL